MIERWRRELDRLGRADPDRDRIRSLVQRGPRMTESDEPGSGRRVLTALVALAVAAGSIGLVVSVFRGHQPGVPTTVFPSVSATGDATPGGTTAPPQSIDTAAICDVPAFDPNVTLLVGNETVQYPTSVLEGPGTPASAVVGPAADALRARLAEPDARNAPADGWRAISTSDTSATFAAPFGGKQWWIEAFERREAGWRNTDEEIVDQRETPAQLGHRLELRWDGELVLDGGRWNGALSLVNSRPGNWVSDGGQYWADAHVFDPSGREIGPGPAVVGGVGMHYDVAPGDTAPVPVALGDKLGSLTPGTYTLVACVPELGLASGPGSLRVVDAGSVADVRVLTYHFTGAGMDALAIGTLAVIDGCLGIENPGGASWYVVWPDGYALVHRDGATVLVNPVGTAVGALGDEVSLGGGGATASSIEDGVIGGIPDSCRSPGEGYFITSGLA